MKTITMLFTAYLRRMVLFVVLGVFAVTTVARVFTLQRRAENVAAERFDQVSQILTENEEGLAAVQEDLNQKYLRNTEIVAYMVQVEKDLPENTERMREIAELMGVEEICVIDETGMIYAGTHPEYNGMTFDSGEQIGFFKPMLTDKSLRLVQEPMPNSYAGILMQYSAVWSSDGTFILQTGKRAESTAIITGKYELSRVLPMLRVNSGSQLYAVDQETGKILSSTLSEQIGKNLTDIGLDLSQIQDLGKGFLASVNGERCYCVFDTRGEHLLGRIVTTRTLYSGLPQYLAEITLVMLALSVVLVYTVRRRVDALVLQNLEDTNEKLHLITAGDLKERLDLRDSAEFSDLSDSVNTLVQSLSDKLEDEHRYQEELKEAAKLADAANEAKSAFLFSMSHDIRTPMNAILGFAAMAEKHVDDEERVRDCLKKINSAGDHLLHLINEVLDMARIEAGKIDLNPCAHSVSESVANVHALFSADMENKGIDFSVICDVQDDIAVFDALHMEQVSMNLISNALKFTPAGGTVRYTVTQIDCDKEGYATYQGTLTDTGIGMSPEFCARVFDAFEQEHTSTISGVSGTGLGLTVTKSLIEKMGGTISCTSELGVGTTFTFCVSFKIGAPEDVQKGESLYQAEEAVSAGKRILLVEDNELNREIAYEILVEAGYLVECAEDGVIAVDKVSHAKPGYFNVILMDIQMPNMNGYEATEAIRKLENPGLANIPIIAFTANDFAEDQNHAYSVGMNGHLAKPIDVPKLLETLSYFM